MALDVKHRTVTRVSVTDLILTPPCLRSREFSTECVSSTTWFTELYVHSSSREERFLDLTAVLHRVDARTVGVVALTTLTISDHGGQTMFKTSLQMMFPPEYKAKSNQVDIFMPTELIPEDGFVAQIVVEVSRCCDPGTFLQDFRKAVAETPQALQQFRALQQDLQAAYDDGLLTDLAFKVGNESGGVTVRANKFLLSSWSPEMRSSLENLPGEVCSLGRELCGGWRDLDRFVRCLYSTSCDHIPENALFNAYGLASHFRVPSLQTQIRERLLKATTPESFCGILELAHAHQDENLKRFCVKEFERFRHRLLNTRRFNKVLKKYPELGSELGIQTSI